MQLQMLVAQTVQGLYTWQKLERRIGHESGENKNKLKLTSVFHCLQPQGCR